MNRVTQLYNDCTDASIKCVGCCVLTMLFQAGVFFTFDIHPVIFVLVLLGAGVCACLALKFGRDYRKSSLMLADEQERRRSRRL